MTSDGAGPAPHPDSLQKLISRRVLELRGRATLEDVAAAARHLGYPWNASRISHFEKARSAPTLESLLVLAAALSAVHGRALGLADLLPDEPDSATNFGADMDTTVPTAVVRSWLEGAPIDLGEFIRGGPEYIDSVEDIAAMIRLVSASPIVKNRWEYQAPGTPFEKFTVMLLGSAVRSISATEQQAAKTLNTTPGMLTAHALALWGLTLPQQRDQLAERWEKLAGEDATAQRKGRITRDLIAELGNAINAH